MRVNPYQPFERFSHQTLLAVGVIITLLGSFIAFAFHARFDGILDVHFVKEVEFHQPFLDNVLNILVTSVLLFFLGRKLNPKTRWIDILNAIMVSRIFLYVSTLLNFQNFMVDKTDKLMAQFPEISMDSTLIWILAMGILMMVFLALYLIYLFMGFKVAINGKKSVYILYFLLILLLSEIILKIIYQFIHF
jgi:hypothetical protein